MAALFKSFSSSIGDWITKKDDDSDNNEREAEEVIALAFHNDDFHERDTSKLSPIEKAWNEFTRTCVEGPFARFGKHVGVAGIMDYTDDFGKTCLHYACESVDPRQLTYILKHCARIRKIVNERDKLNRSAIFFAARSSAADSVALLKDIGGKIHENDWILDSNLRWSLNDACDDTKEVRLRVCGVSVIVKKELFTSAANKKRAHGSFFDKIFNDSTGRRDAAVLNDWCVKHLSHQSGKLETYKAEFKHSIPVNSENVELRNQFAINEYERKMRRRMKKLGKCPLVALEAGAELNLSLRVGTHVRIVCNKYVKQGVVQGMCGIVKSFIYDKAVKLKVPVVQFSKLHPFEPSAILNTNDHENRKKNIYGSTKINSDIVTINVLPYTWSIGSMNKGKYAIFKAIPLIVAYVPDMDIYSNSFNLTFGFEPSMAEYFVPSISNLRCFKAIVAYLDGGFKTLPDDNDVRKTLLKDAKALNLILMAKHLEQVEDLYDMEPFSKYGEPEYLSPDIITTFIELLNFFFKF